MKQTRTFFLIASLLFVACSFAHAQTKILRIELQVPDSDDLVTLTKGDYRLVIAYSDFYTAYASMPGFGYIREQLELSRTPDLDSLIAGADAWTLKNKTGPIDVEAPLVNLLQTKPVGVYKGEKFLKYVIQITKTDGACETVSIAAEKKWNVLASTWWCYVGAGTGE